MHAAQDTGSRVGRNFRLVRLIRLSILVRIINPALRGRFVRCQLECVSGPARGSCCRGVLPGCYGIRTADQAVFLRLGHRFCHGIGSVRYDILRIRCTVRALQRGGVNRSGRRKRRCGQADIIEQDMVLAVRDPDLNQHRSRRGIHTLNRLGNDQFSAAVMIDDPHVRCAALGHLHIRGCFRLAVYLIGCGDYIPGL